MQLTDKAFYNKSVEPEQRPASKYFGSSAQIFDYIIKEAQSTTNAQELIKQYVSSTPELTLVVEDAIKAGVSKDAIKAHLIFMRVDLNDGKTYEEAERNCVNAINKEITTIQDSTSDKRAQGGANMLAPQQQQLDQTPIQDKVQQFKDIGLNDQQIEQVMKTAQSNTEDEELSSEQPSISDPDPKKLLQDKSLKQKQAVLLSFMSFISSLHQKWTQLYSLLNSAEHPEHTMTKEGPRTVPPEYGTKADKQYLRRELGRLQVKISKAGSMWKRLIKLFGEEEMPKDELLKWLDQMQSQMQTRPDPMLQPYKPKKTSQYLDNLDQLEMKVEQEISALEGDNRLASDGNQPAGTTANPMNGQRDSLSSTELEGTGKLAQQMVPPPTTAPAPQTQNQGMPPPDIQDDIEDTRTLQEVIEDLKRDVSVVTEKIENGETILDGESMAPVTTDTGAVPAPAPMVAAEEKIAVDQAAKDYFSDYYGLYGNQLTHDRIAEIVDMVDDVARQYQVKLTTAKVGKIATFVNHSGIDGKFGNHPKLAAILDLNLINYLFKTGMIHNIEDLYKEQVLSSNLRRAAILRAPAALRAKVDQWCKEIKMIHMAEFNKEALPKMKQPSVKGQSDDAVKIDEIGDNANNIDHLLVRPSYLPMEIVDQEVDGAYLKLTIEWDPKHDAACQSTDGLRQSVLSFVKGLESNKEFIDYGFLGQISFDEFNSKNGIAKVSIRTKKPGDAPGHVKTTPKKKAQSLAKMAQPNTKTIAVLENLKESWLSNIDSTYEQWRQGVENLKSRGQLDPNDSTKLLQVAYRISYELTTVIQTLKSSFLAMVMP